MNLSTLKIVAAAYHRKDPSALTVGGIDLFLIAANNARRNAELLHNFEYSRLSGTLSIDGVLGGDLSTADYGGNNGATISGTLSPNATGTFALAGSFNGSSFYLRLTSDPTTSYALWYDTTAGKWWLNPFTYFQAVNATNPPSSYTSTLGAWSQTRDGTSPAGVYTSATSGYTGTPTIALGSAQFAGVREIISFSYLRPDGIRIPIDFSNPDVPIERDRTRVELGRFADSYMRYPSDADLVSNRSRTCLYQRGSMIYRYPHLAQGDVNNPVIVTFEGYGWLPAYLTSQLTDSPDQAGPAEDFLLTYGSDYIQWATIVELNYIFGTFVQREEGNLGPPEQAKADAWKRLIEWDGAIVDAHTTRSR